MKTYNLKRFQTITAGCRSTGAMYMTIKNNLLALQYLMEETILICVIPGPNEPLFEQLNNILVPFVEDVQLLYQGVYPLFQLIQFISIYFIF